MRKEVKGMAYECNAVTPIVIKRIFRIDALSFFEKRETYETSDQFEILEKIAYVMKLMADMPLSEVLKANSDGFYEWLAGFSLDEIIGEIMPEVIALWTISSHADSTPKNGGGPR